MITLLCDNLTRIRNSIARRKSTAVLRKNKGTLGLLSCLWRTRLIEGWRFREDGDLLVLLKYRKDISPIKEIKAISTPSYKKHISKNELSRKSFGEGFLVLSTDRGFFTSFECLKRNLGGMLVCYFGVDERGK